VDPLAKSQMDILKHHDVFSIIWKSWAMAIQQYLTAASYKDADAVIMPDIEDVYPFDLSKREAIMERGYETAERDMKGLLDKIKEKQSIKGRIKNIFKQ
jgi:predicted acylesterase/phospholipase RssA